MQLLNQEFLRPCSKQETSTHVIHHHQTIFHAQTVLLRGDANGSGHYQELVIKNAITRNACIQQCTGDCMLTRISDNMWSDLTEN